MRILLISTADWDHPFWTNKQHVAVALSKLGHEVVYVESLGLRDLRQTVPGDGRRILRRLRRVVSSGQAVEAGVRVVSPFVVPLWSAPAIVFLNRLLFRVQSAWWRARRGGWDMVLTYSPVAGELLRPRKGKKCPIIYHCVDDISAQPGMPHEAVNEFERKLVRMAQVTFTTSPTLTTRVRGLGAEVVVEHSNAVDVGHFANGLAMPEPEDLANLRRGALLGMVGAISPYKLDVDLLWSVMSKNPDWQLVMIGGLGEGQPNMAETRSRLGDLLSLPNVRYLGPKSYSELPAYMARFDVGVVAAPVNEYTVSMSPMKFFEYLAAGIPVVATRLPSLLAYEDAVSLYSDEESFEACVRESLAEPSRGEVLRRNIAAGRTYEQRTKDMLSVLEHHDTGRSI